MRKLPPCKDCKDRELPCHVSCEKYKAWREYLDNQNEIAASEREKYNYSFSERAAKNAVKGKR